MYNEALETVEIDDRNKYINCNKRLEPSINWHGQQERRSVNRSSKVVNTVGLAKYKRKIRTRNLTQTSLVKFPKPKGSEIYFDSSEARKSTRITLYISLESAGTHLIKQRLRNNDISEIKNRMFLGILSKEKSVEKHERKEKPVEQTQDSKQKPRGSSKTAEEGGNKIFYLAFSGKVFISNQSKYRDKSEQEKPSTVGITKYELNSEPSRAKPSHTIESNSKDRIITSGTNPIE